MPPRLPPGFFRHLFGHATFENLLLVFAHFVVYRFAQLLLDGFELFPKVVFALALVHRALHLGRDALADLAIFTGPLQKPHQPLQPFG